MRVGGGWSRLSICGPMQAQRIQADLASQSIDKIRAPTPCQHQEASAVWGQAAEAGEAGEDEWQSMAGGAGGATAVVLEGVYQTSPVADILQGSHDRLYSRLFSS